MEALVILLAILVGLVVLAGVGHLIWLALAGLIRLATGGGPPEPRWLRLAKCPACGELVAGDGRRCETCGLAQGGATADALRDLQTTLRQLRRFHETGALDTPTLERLDHACRQAREDLLEKRPAPHRPMPARTMPAERVEDLPEVLPVEAVMPTPAARPALVRAARPAAPAEEPHRPAGQGLASFMESRNILWGEVVGGLLIVGCSLALVVSLWEKLQHIPYFPFLIFAGITAALIGAGLYTLHHWKLEATSRGLLAIGLLLVPLSFLVLAGLARGAEGGAPEWAADAVAVVVFTALVVPAGRVLAPARPRLLALAVVGPPALSLLVPALLTAPGGLLLLAGAAAACQAFAGGVAVVAVARPRPLAEGPARELLAFLGLASCAAAAALGFLAYRARAEGLGLNGLALPTTLAAMPLLAGGLLVFRGRADGEGGAEALPAWLATTGSGVAVAGMAVLVGALPLAWPQPGALIAVGLVDFALLSAVAVAYRLPGLHAVALGCAAFASLTGFHLLAGNLETDLPSLLVSPTSGSVLVVLTLLAFAASEVLARRGRRADSLAYVGSAGVLALLSLVLIARGGMAEVGRAAVACGLYGAAILAVGVRLRRPWLFTGGQTTLAAAVLLGVARWIEGEAFGHLDPRGLQAYGIGLAAFSLAWVVVRLGLRSRETARHLLSPSWPAVDQVLLAVVVIGQLLLAAWGVAPEALAELTPLGDAAPGGWPAAHVHAFGPGAWALLAAVTVALVVALGEWKEEAAMGLVLAAVTVPILAAGHFAAELASATALRWGLSACFLVASAPLWGRVAPAREALRRLLVALCVVPVLLLTLAAAGVGFNGQATSGPAAGSLFLAVGRTTSDLLPLVLVAAGLVGHGARDRLPGYVFAAGQILVGALVGGYALHVLRSGTTLGDAEGIRMLQLAALGAALWALGWLAARRWRGVADTPLTRPLLTAQLSLAGVACGLLAFLPLTALILDPQRPLSAALAQAGDGLGWPALLLTAGAGLWLVGQVAPRGRSHVAAVALLAASVLAACSVTPWDTGNWLSFHTLLACWVATGLGAGALALVIVPISDKQTAHLDLRSLRGWAWGVGAAVVVLALRACVADPQRPVPSTLATLAVALTAAALALRFGRREDGAASALLVNLAGLFVWQAWGRDTASAFLGVQALCLGLTAALWTACGLGLRSSFLATDPRELARPIRAVSLVVGLTLLAAVVALDVAARLDGEAAARGATAWGALAILAATLTVSLWDGESRLAPAGLYAAGLLAIGLALPHLAATPERLAWSAGLMLAGHVLLAAVVARLAPKIPLKIPELSVDWLVPAQAVVAVVALALSAWTSVAFVDFADRLAGPGTVAVLAAAAFLMTRGARVPALEAWSSPRYATLFLGAAFLTELGWAFLGREGPAPWMHRNVILMTALASASALYGVVLARQGHRLPGWAEAGRRGGPVLGVAALLVLFVVLGQELIHYNPDPLVRRTPLANWAVAAVGVALAGLMAAQVRFAVVPGRDPFGLPERRRTLYVYLAEVMLLGLFLHVRLNLPGLFGDRFVQYWTFLVMGIAFVGVGLAEFFRRRGLPVLAGPLLRTGVFLPLLPLLVFWLRPPDVLREFLGARLPGTVPLLRALDKLPSALDHYALLWFLTGALCAALAAARRSSRYALAAALAANAGLWCLLSHHGWEFLRHPQMWLVPLALIVLAAEFLNRERLGAARAATLRYAGLGLLYLSSAADMFIAGLGNSVVLPLVLAGLSVAGVFAGILLRVRAFLYLGVGFLALVILSMIWHAAVDLAQTWLWYASGIALGLAILGLFALFEKRRNDILRVVERVKAWE